MVKIEGKTLNPMESMVSSGGVLLGRKVSILRITAEATGQVRSDPAWWIPVTTKGCTRVVVFDQDGAPGLMFLGQR